VGGVAPPNDAVLWAERWAARWAERWAARWAEQAVARYNSYNRFNIIRIPELYKGSGIAT